jgi:DNA-directed RNA polymerase subunit alpha
LQEDVPEFLLNVKELRLIPLSGQPGRLVLEVEGEGRVCAADIKPSTDFEIANPELYLATLDSSEAKLYVEFDVELGEGYREAESSGDLSVGTISVDAIFTPIRKVNFTVEPIHVGRESSHQQLYLEIWTDGTMSPPEAISRSAAILVEQFDPFVDYIRVSQLKEEEEAIRLAIPEEQYNMPVEQLNLSVRTMNCLRRGGIDTVGQLIGKEERELLALRNFGQKSMRELEERLKEIGLSFKALAGEPVPATEEEEEEAEHEA